jgi:hypothetical protein
MHSLPPARASQTSDAAAAAAATVQMPLQISPVWYQLRAAEGSETELQLTGGHDVDKGWIAEVRAPVDKVITYILVKHRR